MRFAANYDRNAVVLYAHQWAYGRNPAFYDYEHLGGDCTNFASQCVFAGSGVMNFTPTVKAEPFCPEIAGLFCHIAGLFCHSSRTNLSLKPACFDIAIS